MFGLITFPSTFGTTEQCAQLRDEREAGSTSPLLLYKKNQGVTQMSACCAFPLDAHEISWYLYPSCCRDPPRMPRGWWRLDFYFFLTPIPVSDELVQCLDHFTLPSLSFSAAMGMHHSDGSWSEFPARNMASRRWSAAVFTDQPWHLCLAILPRCYSQPRTEHGTGLDPGHCLIL